MKKKYINPTAQAIQLEINPLLDFIVQSTETKPEQTIGDNPTPSTPSKGFSISNDGPEYDEEL